MITTITPTIHPFTFKSCETFLVMEPVLVMSILFNLILKTTYFVHTELNYFIFY